MGKLVMNVVKKSYKFRVKYRSGNVKDLTVVAESEDAARLLLPHNVESAELVKEKEVKE